MSVFLGLYAFSYPGLIYGPLLISFGQILYDILNAMSFDQNDQLVFISESEEKSKSQPAATSTETTP